MPTLQRPNSAIVSQKRLHGNINKSNTLLSSGDRGDLTAPIPPLKFSQIVRIVLDELQEILVDIIFLIAGLAALAPIAATGIQHLMKIFNQPPIA